MTELEKRIESIEAGLEYGQLDGFAVLAAMKEIAAYIAAVEGRDYPAEAEGADETGEADAEPAGETAEERYLRHLTNLEAGGE